MCALLYHERLPADGQGDGLLILTHGRGANELDLTPLGDIFDPDQRFHVIFPRAPLALEGLPGFHWYELGEVGRPQRESFLASVARIGAFHDQLWEDIGIAPERTVLGGFSQGAVMSYTLGLSAGRPAPAGILAFSGFIPALPDWKPDLASRDGLPVFIAHGRFDPVISVEFSRRARELLSGAGLEVDYGESDVDHTISPVDAERAAAWLRRVLPPR